MSKSRICSLAAMFAGSLVAQAATAAAETGFYVGGSYGITEKDEARDGFDAFASSVFDFVGYDPGTRSNSLDKRSQGYGFIGGYRLFENFAIEGGYMQLGTVKYRDRSSGFYTGGPTDFVVNVDSEIGGIAVSALGILPVSYRWELYGRAGVMFSTHDFKFFFSDNVNGLKDEFSESATDFLAGAGASLMLAEVYTVRAEFIRVFDAGNKENGEGDVDVLSLGVTVKF